MGVVGGLQVEGHHVGAGLHVQVGHLVGVGDHEVGVHGDVSGGLDGAKHVRAKGEVGDKVAVHHVKVHVVGRLDALEVLPQARKVCRQDGRGDKNVFKHQMIPFDSVVRLRP